MKASQLFTKTLKDSPAGETAKNAQLLIRAGYIYKVMAGVYTFTPLGLRVLENIKQIVREEMNAIGGQELIMSSLQNQDTWQTTGRWDDEVVDVWFKSKLKDGTEVGFGWSHEEAILEMIKQHVKSYKDLPVSVYQFQTKLRNELRAKSGIMRGREFVMKDMYSLHTSAEDLDTYYDKVKQAYAKIFDRLGLGKDTYLTFASGGAFTKFSHEFQTICDAGEDILFFDKSKNIAVNEEVLDEATKELGIKKEDLEKVKSAEVANIFNFGTEKSKQMDINYTDADGQQHPIYLASYGIGITRVMGVIVEKLADEKGLVWPDNIAPFRVVICRLGDEAEAVKQADELYDLLQQMNVSVMYDERVERPGKKFADADLIGYPHRVVVSQKTASAGQYEHKKRTDSDSKMVSMDELKKLLA